MSADLTATEAELLAAAQALYSFGVLIVEYDRQFNMWAVWTPPGENGYEGELIGASYAKSEAIAQAIACLRQWEAQ